MGRNDKGCRRGGWTYEISRKYYQQARLNNQIMEVIKIEDLG